MKKNIDYDELYEELEDCCHTVLDKCTSKIEKNGLHNPIETIIHNISITSRYIAPPEKKLVKDFEIIKKELGEVLLNERLLKEGVAEFLASVVWYRRKRLNTLRCKKEETNYDNYIKLVTMIYEAGRQRYLEEKEKSALKEVATIMWEYFHSERERTDQGLTSENAVRLARCATELDKINERYEEKELNNGKIIYDSYSIVTEYVLQKCFEECCSKRYGNRQFIEKFLSENSVNIDSEIRRFSKYYKKYVHRYCERETSGIIDIGKNLCIPVTHISNIELLYFSSLKDGLFANEWLGKDRERFAKKFIRNVFGDNLDITFCIVQAQILLAICGYCKISPKLLEHADDKMIEKLVNYLNKPVLIDGEKIYISNPIVEQWTFACYIADKLYKMTGDGKKLSESRKKHVFEYASKLEGMYPFQVKLLYFQDNEKFIASSEENLVMDNPVAIENSWLGQQRKILSDCISKTAKKFKTMCKKFSDDTGIELDKLILEMVHGDFRQKCKNETSQLHIEKNIKKTICFMYEVYNENRVRK